MRKTTRLALVLCASLVALAFSNSAFAAFAPRLIISHEILRPSAGGQTLIQYVSSKDADSTFRLVIFAPQGYQGTLAAPPGTSMGTVSAHVELTAISTQTVPEITGTITSDDPAKYAAPATQCTGSPTHSAVWLLQLTAAGQTLAVPVYVDTTLAAPESSFAQFKLTVCLPPPDVPESAGGAKFGAKVVDASLVLKAGVFVLPGTAGQYTWRSIVTPWKPGGVVNPGGTVEARGLLRIPVQLTLVAKHVAAGLVKLSGTLIENGVGLKGFPVQLWASATAKNLGKGKPLATPKTNAKGAFSKTVKVKKGKTMLFQAEVDADPADLTSAGCASPTLPPVPCTTATLDPFFVLSPTRKAKG